MDADQSQDSPLHGASGVGRLPKRKKSWRHIVLSHNDLSVRRGDSKIKTALQQEVLRGGK
jgi:hypothetical protein